MNSKDTFQERIIWPAKICKTSPNAILSRLKYLNGQPKLERCQNHSQVNLEDVQDLPLASTHRCKLPVEHKSDETNCKIDSFIIYY